MMMRHALLASAFAFCGVAANAATDTMAGATTATVVDVIVASAEPETVLALADRILVLRKGEMAREFKDEALSKDRLLAAA